MKKETRYWEANAEYQNKAPHGVKITGKSLVTKEVEIFETDFGGWYYLEDGMYTFAHVQDYDFESCKRMIENDRKTMIIRKFTEDLRIIEVA